MPDNEEFIRSLEDATISIVLDMEKRVKKACLLVENQAKMDCPVDEGVLRASITSEVEVTENEIVGRIGSNEEYAPYVHNGTGIYAKDGKPLGYIRSRAADEEDIITRWGKEHSHFFCMRNYLTGIELKEF